MAAHKGEIIVNAPLHQVFMMWRNLENLPRYMSHVKEVRALGGGRWRWRGVFMGIEEEWDAVITRLEDDRVIAWQSVSGFKNSGEVRFEPYDGRTRLTVHFEYDPPAGILGDAAEALFVGADFDDALARDLDAFKQHVEQAA